MDAPYSLSTDRPVQVGMVVLQSDETLERDMRRLLPPEVEVLVSRVPSGTEVTQDSLQAMESVLKDAASLLPQGATFSAVGYGCTSGTAQIGASKIRELVKAGIETPQVTEPVSALIAACRRLDVSRIGLLSPYVEAVSDHLRSVLSEAGISVTCFASFNEPLEENVVRISAASVHAAALKLGQSDDCEAVFLSCTNLRTLQVIEPLETQLGKPVLSSNQVLIWHLCELAGVPIVAGGAGKLLRRD